jgi:hypothetical protein
MIHNMLKTGMCVLCTLVMLMWVGGPGAQEHPTEHPSEHPTSEKETVSIETLAAAIESYIKEDAELKGGWFTIWDEKNKEPLALDLVKVHKERLSALGNDVYFACTDLKTPEDKVYDLDFFMKDTEDGLEVTEVMIHKESGEARYGWKEKNGVWVRVES